MKSTISTASRRAARIVVPALLLACGLAGTAQQRKRPVTPKSSKASATKRQPAEASSPSIAQAIRENNLGLALMSRHDFEDALGKFQTACVLNPDSDTGCLNMGIALLNMGHFDDARKILEKSVERDLQSARAWYNLALLERATGKPGASRDDFQKAAAIDPEDADTQYFLGYLASQAKLYDQAIAEFKRAIELNPFHVSAEYGLSQADQHVGDSEGAKAHLERFQRIAAEKLGRPIRFLYGEQGKYSLGQEMAAPVLAVPPAIPVQFVNVTAISGLPERLPVSEAGRPVPAARRTTPPAVGAAQSLASFLGSGACIIDYDGDGRPDIFLANADGKGNAALYRNTGKGTFVNVTKSAKIDFHGQGMGCAIGDYDNDGHADLAVSSGDGVILFHNEGDGTFRDVTVAAGLRPQVQDENRSNEGIGGLAMGITFVDYDNDGDLDLYVTRFADFPLANGSQPFTFPEDSSSPGNILWRNNGNETFVDRTKDLALGGDAPSVGAIGSDLGNHGAIDLVVTGWQKFPTVFTNTREGAFRKSTPWAISMPGPAAGVVAADVDHDGWVDLAFTHWASPGVTIWRNVQGKSFERFPLASPAWMRAWGIAALDYDNDGWVDLVAVGETFAGEGRIALLRNEGPAGFRDVTHQTGLDKIALRNPRAVIAFDYDGDGSEDLLITQDSLPPILLKNVGGDKNGWLKIALSGDPDNKSAIGTAVDIFSGGQRQKSEVSGASGYLGQGPAEILAGLGGESTVDVLKLRWLTGVLQYETQIPGRKPVSFPEREPGEPTQQITQ